MGKTVITCRTDGCGCDCPGDGSVAGTAVRWQGAQKDVLGGDISGRVHLAPLAGLKHLYGLGPLAELKGEVTILHSRASISRVQEEKQIVTEQGFNHQACFLVYAQVKEWQEVPLPVGVTEINGFENALPQIAVQAGVNADEPFPFLLRGQPESVEFHILNKTDGLPHTPALHDKAKIHFTMYRPELEVIGFHSLKHRGIFTPGNSNIHLHLRTDDDAVSGHVEELSLKELRLYLPLYR